jgi:hypothetical protein
MIDPNEYLTLLDFVLAPFIAAFIYIIALNFRNKHYPEGHPWRPYFIPGLAVKMIGALLIGLIYAYYYKGGDTYNYHYHAKIINSAINESFEKWINLIFSIPDKTNIDYYEYTSKMYWYQTGSTYTTSAIAALLSAPLGSLYLPTALLFASISFTGVWALFRTFSKLYPHLTRQVAIATLFIPSVCIWGSSVFKDTISLFALGWLTYGLIQLLYFRNFKVQIVLTILISVLLAANVKVYILIAISPPVLFWALGERVKKIKNAQLRLIATTIALLAIIAFAGLLFTKDSEFTQKYSIDEIASTSNTTRNWISYVNTVDLGSGYDLGEFEPSLGGMVSKFPQAVNVALFRPYLWEAKKIIVLINALESLIFFVLTLKLIFSTGLGNIILSIVQTPAIQFTFFYSIVFAFAVGISSYNFGALSRYRIPCLPFYLLAITLIYYEHQPLKKSLWRAIGL